MSLLVWRYSHFLLALISSFFLLIASITGGILAFEPITISIQPYNVISLDEVSLNQTIESLNEKYTEIIQIEVTEDDFVTASVITDSGDIKKIYIDPITAENIGLVKKQSRFFSFITNLHRSLFLKTIGRIFVGIVSLLLCFIAVTGVFLLAKRQGGFKNWFKRIQDSDFNQKYHVVFGRWLVLPIIIIAVTGVFLSIEKLSLIPKDYLDYSWNSNQSEFLENKSLSILFETISLDNVRSLTFPFSKSKEDFYELSLSDRVLYVDQFSGRVVKESHYPFVKLATRWNLALHTGRGSLLWSVILFIASSSMLFFMFSGFSIALKRIFKSKKIKKVLGENECEYIILVGSETGNTYSFAKILYEGLIKAGKNVFISSLNEYTLYEKAKHLIVLTATYGEGEAPSNARSFEKKFKTCIPLNNINFSVVGFGSLMYPNYCKFAVDVDQMLNSNPKFKSIMPLYKINEESKSAFEAWIKKWSANKEINLSLELAKPMLKKFKTTTFKVVGKKAVDQDNTFLLKLDSLKNIKFNSGDLLNISPKEDNFIRQYSIAKIEKNLLLSIKKHDHGICSSFLSKLNIGDSLSASFKTNSNFHFPKKAHSIILISNGTGIAPFLGMINENKSQIPLFLFWGGRTRESLGLYEKYINGAISKKYLSHFQKALSQEDKKEYVQDVLIKNKNQVCETIKNYGVIMICGSLSMQHDVLDVLEQISTKNLNQPLSDFENNGQLLLDCY